MTDDFPARLAGRTSAPSDRSILENLVDSVVQDAIHGFKEVPFLSAVAQESLANSLVNRLIQSAEQAFTWYYKVFQITPGLRTRDPGGLKKLFFANGVEGETLRFLATFPALGRLWAVQIEAWQTFIGDFLEHAAAFAARLGLPADWKISGISLDLSDLHNGGKTVLRVRFCDGQTWFYKPRSGKNEKAWFELLRWLNGKQIDYPFQIPEIHTSADHCWMEAVEHQPCRTGVEVAAFYQRAGALLYLYYALGGIDLHCGNLIAAGENPVIIDCETLFHESVVDPDFPSEMERSILRCGMLPVKHTSIRRSVSALAADELGTHTVWLENEAKFARDYVEDIVSGFGDIHQFLNDDEKIRSTFLEIVQTMSRLTWRKVFRPTAHYQKLLLESRAASAWLEKTDKITGTAEEIRSLEKGDIPIFHGPGTLGISLLSQEIVQDSAISIREAFQ